MGNGRAAMDLMGQWAPSTFAANTKDKKGLGENVGLVPVPGRRRRRRRRPASSSAAATASPIGKDAPPEAVDFAQVPREPGGRQQGAAPAARILPVAKGTESSVTDPNMKAVLDARGKASFVQLYLDQAYAPAVGQAVNDAVQQLFAGKASAEQVSKKIADAAKAG